LKEKNATYTAAIIELILFEPTDLIATSNASVDMGGGASDYDSGSWNT